MHLGKGLASIVLTFGLSAALVGCGFQLRGTVPHAQQTTLQHINFNFPAEAEDLEKRLAVSLTSMGIQTLPNSDAKILRVLDYTPRRQILNGRLTEVTLRLTVTFRLEAADGTVLTEPRTLTAARSYQYERATVNTENQEESYLNELLLQDLTQKITNQIINNRLPTKAP